MNKAMMSEWRCIVDAAKLLSEALCTNKTKQIDMPLVLKSFIACLMILVAILMHYNNELGQDKSAKVQLNH